MPRRIACWLAFAAASVAVLRIGWAGPAGHPATVLTRVDVVAAVLILAVAPWPARRRFGPTGPGWLARAVRVPGYAAVFALLLVKAEVERRDGIVTGGHAGLAGAWTGEIVFLLVLAAYTAGLLAVTARRPPAGRTALAIGTAAGVAAGLVSYALPPLHPLHVPAGWLADLYQAGRLLAVPLLLAAGVTAGLLAARRTPARRGRLTVTGTRSRQGFRRRAVRGWRRGAAVRAAEHRHDRAGTACAGTAALDLSCCADAAQCGEPAAGPLRRGRGQHRGGLPGRADHLPGDLCRTGCLGRDVRCRPPRPAARRGRRRWRRRSPAPGATTPGRRRPAAR